MAKLKELLGEVFDETPKVDKHQVVEGVKNYGIVGKQLYNNSNIMEIAKQLSQVAESAHNHILGESDDWFDKHIIVDFGDFNNKEDKKKADDLKEKLREKLEEEFRDE